MGETGELKLASSSSNEVSALPVAKESSPGSDGKSSKKEATSIGIGGGSIWV